MKKTIPISAADFTKMRERCGLATEGPWAKVTLRSVTLYSVPTELSKKGSCSRDDEIFCAKARTDLPRCLDEIEALQARLAEATNSLQKIHSYRADEPDWNMVMAIAEDFLHPMELVFSDNE